MDPADAQRILSGQGIATSNYEHSTNQAHDRVTYSPIQSGR